MFGSKKVIRKEYIYIYIYKGKMIFSCLISTWEIQTKIEYNLNEVQMYMFHII